MSKLVSVIIPTYKRPDVLSRAVNSVLAQTYQNIEVIVVDDNGIGTEYGLKTEEVMSPYKDDSRVIYVQHENNRNGSAARNTGFRASRGEYIMFLDDDDEFLPEKVVSQLNRLEELDDSWGACYSDTIRISFDGKTILTRSKETAEGDLYFEELKRNLFISAGSNLMIRRHVIDEVGGFDESFRRNQDIEFLVKILKKYKLARSATIGLKVYAHKKSHNLTFEEITQKYLENFKNEIDSLDENKRKEFYRMINLQRFRAFCMKRATHKLAIDLVKSKEVKPLDAIRYFIHLGYRRIFKVNCGFKF